MSAAAASWACGLALASAVLLAPAAVSAQAVTAADLVGATVVADIHRTQTVKRMGRTASITGHQKWTLSIRADEIIEFRVEVTVRGPMGTRKAPPNTGMLKLNQPRDTVSRGGGEALMTFADGTLTFTRTFPAGAYRARFAFERKGDAFVCTVTEVFARQDGTGEIRFESPFGGEVVVLSSKQLPSPCRVEKK